MIYVGGKAKQAKKIAELILASRGSRSRYLEPFMGGGSIFEVLAPRFDEVILADNHEDLVLMWRAIARGWNPPMYISYQRYQELRYAEPSALRGWAGFAASYRSKWFRGWAGWSTDVDHLGRNTKSLIVKGKVLRAHPQLTIRCAPYHIHQVDSNTVVYSDPPYAKMAERYYAGQGAILPFSTPAFWRKMDSWVEQGAQVFVSEFRAPADWPVVYRFPRWISLSHSSNAMKYERLYAKTP